MLNSDARTISCLPGLIRQKTSCDGAQFWKPIIKRSANKEKDSTSILANNYLAGLQQMSPLMYRTVAGLLNYLRLTMLSDYQMIYI